MFERLTDDERDALWEKHEKEEADIGQAADWETMLTQTQIRKDKKDFADWLQKLKNLVDAYRHSPSLDMQINKAIYAMLDKLGES